MKATGVPATPGKPGCSTQSRVDLITVRGDIWDVDRTSRLCGRPQLRINNVPAGLQDDGHAWRRTVTTGVDGATGGHWLVSIFSARKTVM